MTTRFRRQTTGLIACAIAALTLALATTSASAASTRAEYVAQVDPICQQEHAAEKPIIRSFSKRVNRLEKRMDSPGTSKRVTRLIVRGYDLMAQVQRDADSRIASVVPAAGDEASIAQWLQLRADFTQVFQRSAHVLAHRQPERALDLLSQALDIEDQAEQLIQPFGFSSCGRIIPGF